MLGRDQLKKTALRRGEVYEVSREIDREHQFPLLYPCEFCFALSSD